MFQTGLIDEVLKTEKMENYNCAKTSASTVSLGKDKDGDPFIEEWGYVSIAGILVYLENNSCPILPST